MPSFLEAQQRKNRVANMLLLAVLCAAMSPSLAAEREVFRDTFDEGLGRWEPRLRADRAGWTTLDASAPQAALYGGSGHMQLAASDPAIAAERNFRLDARMRFLSSSNFPGGLRFGTDPATGAGWALWTYPASGSLYLYRASAWHIDTPPLTTIASVHGIDMSATDASGGPIFHDVRVDVVGGFATVRFDGVEVLSRDLGAATAGAIALDVSNQPVVFDDVVFTGLDVTGFVPAAISPPIQTLFQDDFSGTLGAWLPSPVVGGTFGLTADQKLLFDGGGHTQLYVPGLACGDCTATVDVTLATGLNYPGGIRFRVNATTGQGYEAWLDPAGQTVRLLRVDSSAWHIDPDWVQLAQAQVTLAAGAPFELGLRGTGSLIELLWNGQAVASATDATYAEGTFALDPSNQVVTYDNVRVTAPGAFAVVDLFENAAFDPFDPSVWYESPLGDGTFALWSRTPDGYASYAGGVHKQAATLWNGTDYRLDTVVRFPVLGSFPGGPCVRVDAATGRRYCAWIYPGTQQVKLLEILGWHVDTNGYSVLGSASVPIAAGIDYPVSIEATGSEIRVWWNDPDLGVPAIQATSDLVPSGGIGFDTSASAVQYGEVLVSGTEAPPVPPVTFGPGGPILALYGKDNASGQYLMAILEGEGLTEYEVRRIDTVTPSYLGAHEVVIVGEMALSPAEAAMLVAYAEAGGNLVAMRPDPQLYDVLGVAAASGTTAEGYYLADTSVGAGMGITGVTMQFHGTADHVAIRAVCSPLPPTTAADLGGILRDPSRRSSPSALLAPEPYQQCSKDAIEVATLYTNRETATPHPAVTLRYLPGGGSASAFLFNMPLSVVYTRQGNPAWVGQDRDCGYNSASCILRSDDLFFGPSLTDPLPDYVDFGRIGIPQADELQRLLVNLIYEATSTPLPRSWYLPRGFLGAIVETGDDHGSGNTVPRFNELLLLSPPGCSVADWECYRMTSYAYNGVLSPAAVDSFAALGFEPALHISTSCQNYTEASLRTFMNSDLTLWDTNYGTGKRPQTNRTHCIAWSGWATTAAVSEDFGIRFDTNYYYWPPQWGIVDRPGYMTGSGLPQRFARIDGSPYGVYQAHTHVTDETAPDTATMDLHIGSLMAWAHGPEQYPIVITTNNHTDHAVHWGTMPVVNAARQYGVPIVTAKQMLDWLDGRDGTTYANVAWNGSTLTFTAIVHPLARNLRTMVPLVTAAAAPLVTRDGQPVPYELFPFKGRTYVRFPAANGAYSVSGL